MIKYGFKFSLLFLFIFYAQVLSSADNRSYVVSFEMCQLVLPEKYHRISHDELNGFSTFFDTENSISGIYLKFISKDSLNLDEKEFQFHSKFKGIEIFKGNGNLDDSFIVKDSKVIMSLANFQEEDVFFILNLCE